ncbi:MAG: hypothetical protein ACHQ9S_19905, partial [Candidatus Binatia bacterium]
MMGNKSGPFALLASVITASALCFGATSVWAQQVTLGNVSGNAGNTVPVTAKLGVGSVTPGIAGAQSDFSYDSANVAVQGKQVCKADNTVSCTTDAECVAANGAGDTCIVVPD